jgi:hypothetical protein
MSPSKRDAPDAPRAPRADTDTGAEGGSPVVQLLWRYRAVVLVLAFAAGMAVVAPWRTPPEVDAVVGQGAASMLPTVPTTWRTLGRLDALTGFAPPEVTALAGRRVAIPGFIVPLEDSASTVSEFLLVPYFGACIHMPPPPPNQMIYVKMVGAPIPVDLWEPMTIEGELTVSTVDSPYGKVGYVIAGRSVRPYEPTTPDESRGTS